jgi:hypothetical protein
MSFEESKRTRESRAREGEKVVGKGTVTKALLQHANRGEGTAEPGPYSTDFEEAIQQKKAQKSRRPYCRFLRQSWHKFQGCRTTVLTQKSRQQELA